MYIKTKSVFYNLTLSLMFVFFIAKYELFAEEKIVFLHIPKTGGVSVSSLLMNEYHLNQLKGPDPLLYSYGCHYSLYELNQFLDVSNFKLITFLRNPIARVLSEQRYCIDKHHGKPFFLQVHKLPIQGNPIDTAQNVVCKMLSGLDDQNPNITIDRHLEHAKRNLAQQFFFVGITEKMEESIELLYSHLGWQTPEEIPHFNSTASTEDRYPSKVLEAIAERNWADIELYEYALTLYEDQKNQILSHHNHSQHEQVFHDWYVYTFDQKLRGYGWGHRELLKDQTAYRWVSDKNEAGIDFYLNYGKDYLLKIELFVQKILFGQLTLLVNNVRIPINHRDKIPNESTSYEWVECYAKIPKSVLKQGEKTRLTFKMNPPTQPMLLTFYQSNNQQTIEMNYNIGKFACKRIFLKSIP